MAQDDHLEDQRAYRAKRESPFLNPKQAAHYLGIATRTLQEHRRADTGPRYRRHCRHIRYHIDDLDAWSMQVAYGSECDD